MRIAIVGAGPSGFFAAGHLLGRGHEVDLYDRLPTPWGLVRGGVAPDHPNIKSVSRVFEKIAARPGFRFFGNVEVGSDVSHQQLLDWYHAVIYTVGTAIDRRSGVPGEQLPGSHSATEFVGWYNGHPDYAGHEFDLSGERAIVIGNGNVAIDVARMLTLTRDELAATDAADHAIEALDAANIREIVVLGRRGPHQAAFTNPELLELGELLDADVVVDPADLEADPALAGEELDELDEVLEHTLEILGGYAQRAPSGKRKRVVLRFMSSPVEIVGDGRVEAVTVVRNRLERDAGGVLRARATGLTQELPAGIVFRAIGYQGVAVPGVPFDAATGLIPHDGRGRVTGAERTYVAGWIKRGPSGVIGTNKRCAIDTSKALLADLEAGVLGGGPAAEPDVVERELRERIPDLVDHAGWASIDAAERAAGEPAGRPRVKLTTIPDLLEAAAAPNEAVR
ncbi:NAD(P)-binding protein [Conexibacter stalactiti]|uniref:NADP oxidoreductase n=1 Tax=Conexibacter stalactiti TaxID=1940611 RepID=A0ABU4HIU8_9ACTN|nr:NAD(P)-binding protein [Conexibacter stalactiti]MDW5593187.1 NADP oxidoreductase [Conexibacter stalactiti]MEC5033828.1 NAD(P)-binding protein [Conexibacter stalactiti]